MKQCNKCGEFKPKTKFGKKSSIRCIDCLNADRREQRFKKKNDLEYQLKLAYDKIGTIIAIELGKKGLSFCYKCNSPQRAFYENDHCQQCGGQLSRRFYR